MAETPPAQPLRPAYTIPIPPLPSRAHQQRRQTSRTQPRQSLLHQSFSLGPESLVHSSALNGPNNVGPSYFGHPFGVGGLGDAQAHHSDPNASVMAASPRTKRTTRASAVAERKRADRSSMMSGISSQQQSLPPQSTPAVRQLRFGSTQTNDGAPSDTQTQAATELEEEEMDEEDWGIVDRMRLWRHDAMMQHLHDSAVFWGDKILSWTRDPNDAFWLAQAYFLHQQYARAEQILTQPFYLPGSRPQQTKGKGRELNDIPVLDGEMDGGPVMLIDRSVSCRYLAAQCMVRSGRWADALEMLGESNPWQGTGRSGPAIPNPDGGIKVEASMCHLRGVLMTRLNRQDRAKEHFMEALALDVKCYDAFHELINGNLLGIDEGEPSSRPVVVFKSDASWSEWEFVQGLQYMQQVPEDADFVRLVYTIRLKKEKHVAQMALARQRLVEDYGMGENPDVLFAFAESMYAQYRWQDAFTITSRIQELVGIHPTSLPIHIACMHNLRHLHPRLFLLAHQLVDKDPDEPVSWYAVGVYYLMTRKFLDARKFFSKANLMDPRFGPAWIGFAHSYSYEGEHDHAIVAYSTAARLFPGMHLPALFLGMEYLQVNSLALAGEYFGMAQSICDTDPLLYNEQGVLAFYNERYEEAAQYLEKAISLANHVQGTDAVWATTYLNLGQAYRKLGRYTDAKKAFNKVIKLNPRHAQGYACLGIICHLMGDCDHAIQHYHESLAIEPLETNTIDLLNLVLELNADLPPGNLGVLGLPGGEDIWRETVNARRTGNQAQQLVTPGRASGLGGPGDQSSVIADSSLGNSSMEMA
ncbi:anaphase promoting complex subunit cdc16 [Tulasnella sp. 427]|nr:anaphase promoting complex subunit cdc16 [Tulasnella sp. 427]